VSFFSRLFGGKGSAGDKGKAPSAAPAPQPASDERPVRVVALTRETADATTVTLANVDGTPIVHTPGQFMMLRFDLPSGPVSRAYSICTPPGTGEVSVTVKRIAGGLVSTHVVERVKVGDVLAARGPMGRFVPPAAARRLFLVAGGSGITPIMSQLRHALATYPGSQLTLLYGNRSEADVIFRAQLAELAAQHPSLTVQHVLSDGRGELSAAPGILDEATVAGQLARLAPRPGDFDAYLMCGPEPMMAAARKAMLAHGVPEATILEERFTASTLHDTAGLPTGPTELRFTHDGKAQVVVMQPDETILETAQRLNLALDFSCMAGQCGTCMAKLDAGDVQLEEPNCLSPAERAQGMILTCVARPKGPCAITTILPR
jgi:ferredoxin-NADP reductase